MVRLIGLWTLNGPIVWQLLPRLPADTHFDAGLGINFSFISSEFDLRTASRMVDERLRSEGIEWLRRLNASQWQLDVDALRPWVAAHPAGDYFDKDAFDTDLSWLSGTVRVTPNIHHSYDELRRTSTILRFPVYQEEYVLNRNMKIFLSHKGVDKPIVQRFYRVLKTLGFDPWLDEEAMPAGTELHRGIRAGFKESCAAVFFITPQFRDKAAISRAQSAFVRCFRTVASRHPESGSVNMKTAAVPQRSYS